MEPERRSTEERTKANAIKTLGGKHKKRGGREKDAQSRKINITLCTVKDISFVQNIDESN